MSQDTKMIQKLLEVLEAAYDHLEYCGYGDSWERECARDANLPNKIYSTLEEGKKHLEEKSKCH